MLFNSFIFIFVFLPLVVTLYFTANHFKKYNLALVFLMGMSFWFYGYFNPAYLSILIISLLVNYGLCSGMRHLKEQKKRKLLLTGGIVLNLLVLFFYKYFDFFWQNINAVFKTDFPMYNILLPLGISFFTFQQISYVIDAYKGETEGYERGIKGFLHYAVYVSFFPQLVAGPIVLHNEVMPQLLDESKKKLSFENLNLGLFIFVRGLAKKILIADSFAGIADSGFSLIDEMNTVTALVVMLGYTLQIYFDFAGYSDMAIGLGRMLNIELPVNFDSPYKAVSINDFWKRWHMTLTRFFRIYVYIPLGGNRKGLARTCINLFIIFLLSGLWHGANWTFVLWGVLHGIAHVLYRLFHKKFSRVPTVIGWICTFLFVNLAWVLFRATSIGDAFSFYKHLFVWSEGGIHPLVLETFAAVPEVVFISFLLPVVSASVWVWGIIVCGILATLFMRNTIEKASEYTGSFIQTLVTVILMVWCICSMSGASTFLYFNF